MNLGEIRQGIADVLSDLPDVRVEALLPNSPDSLLGSNPLIVIQPGEPYVRYSEGSGRVNKNEVMFRIICLPLPGMGAERVQTVLDGFLSCGTSEARSIRSKLGENISANGTACAVSVQEAVIRTYRIGALDVTGAEVQVQVTARC